MNTVMYRHRDAAPDLRWPPLLTASTVGFLLPAPANINGPADRGVCAPRSGSASDLYVRAGKRALDLGLVLLSLPMTLMVVLLCALALWVEGGRPFYWQERLGRGGRTFRLLKLRTMVPDADALLAVYLGNDPVMRAEWNTNQKLLNDPRITRVGRVLRATSLDELPQLWNVLKGEMSLVGPRPMMPEQLNLYGDASCYLSVKPGITGLWQVSTRNEKGFSYRAHVDAVYCRSLSLWHDLSLIVRTVGVMVRRTGV